MSEISLKDIQYRQQVLAVQEMQAIQKGLTSSDAEEVIAASKHWKDVQERSQSDLKAHFVDPYNTNYTAQGYVNKTQYLSPLTLRKMAKTPIVKSIVETRVEQISAFCQPQANKYDTGFIVRKRAAPFTEVSNDLNSKELKRAQAIAEFMLNCGTTSNAWHMDTFETFLRKLVKDSLELDAMTFETIRNRKGQPVEFAAVDGATIRLADTYDDDIEGKKEHLRVKGYLPSYVQVIDEALVAEWYPWELCYGIRNHTTNIYNNGYGTSELEDLVNIVTWILHADQYNGKFFSQGSNPKGFLKVNGQVSQPKLNEFRNMWQSMVAGTANAHKTPILSGKEIEWVDLHKPNKDMEFGKWQEHLIKLQCAIYKIDPSEIGFPLQGGVDTKPMFEGNNEARLKYSKDKGLKPLLRFIQAKINKYIITPLDPEYELVFVGLDAETEGEELDRDIKKGDKFLGFKEMRKKYGYPEDLAEGDFILNPQYMQYHMAQMQGGMDSNEFMDEYDEGQSDSDQDTSPYLKELPGGGDNPFLKSVLQDIQKDLYDE